VKGGEFRRLFQGLLNGEGRIDVSGLGLYKAGFHQEVPDRFVTLSSKDEEELVIDHRCSHEQWFDFERFRERRKLPRSLAHHGANLCIRTRTVSRRVVGDYHELHARGFKVSHIELPNLTGRLFLQIDILRACADGLFSRNP